MLFRSERRRGECLLRDVDLRRRNNAKHCSDDYLSSLFKAWLFTAVNLSGRARTAPNRLDMPDVVEEAAPQRVANASYIDNLGAPRHMTHIAPFADQLDMEVPAHQAGRLHWIQSCKRQARQLRQPQARIGTRSTKKPSQPRLAVPSPCSTPHSMAGCEYLKAARSRPSSR